MEFSRILTAGTLSCLLGLAAVRPSTAQSCPPNSPDCTQWSTQQTLTLSKFGGQNDEAFDECEFTYKYRTRTCGSRVEYYFDDVTYQGMCEGMDHIAYLHHNFNGSVELAVQFFMDHMTEGSPIPYCGSPGGGISRAYVYTASCGAWVSCEYDVDPASRICDAGFDPPYPDYDENDLRKVTVYKWQSCGTTCCRRIFEICRDPDVIYGIRYLIRSTLIEKVRLAPCSEQDKYGSQNPCYDGC